MTSYFISFINNKQSEILIKKKKKSSKDGPFMLCLDNADEIIDNDKVKFQKYLQHLHQECH